MTAKPSDAEKRTITNLINMCEMMSNTIVGLLETTGRLTVEAERLERRIARLERTIDDEHP